MEDKCNDSKEENSKIKHSSLPKDCTECSKLGLYQTLECHKCEIAWKAIENGMRETLDMEV